MYEKISESIYNVESTLPHTVFQMFHSFPFKNKFYQGNVIQSVMFFFNFGRNVVLLLIVIKFINVWSKLCQLTKIYHLTISSPTLQKFVSESARVAGMVKEQRRMSERARLIRKMLRGVLITFHIA